METKEFQLTPKKRPSKEYGKSEGLKKKLFTGDLKIEDDAIRVDKIYKFRVLLPNGTSLGVKMRDPEMEVPLEQFIDLVKREYFRAMRQTESQKLKRKIDWKSPGIYFEDAFDNVFTKKLNVRDFKHNTYHILRLHDGSGEAETYENMWDLTPDTELLMELPAEYNFETALADLIDNSLQAVWSNAEDEKRLLSVELAEDRISIFDTGPGMDGSDEHSIVKWGKMGASMHRSSRGHGIGGKPPYLLPYFGMFGYGGPIASMHLGRLAIVSSKTRASKKVYTLHLEREALLSNSSSRKTWRTDGGIRHPTEDEIRRSAHCSFTKVEIFEPKMKGLDIKQLQCKLKDIYFPYIQCDEMSNTSRTIRPIEFQVNGTDLAEIQGGEVAVTNLHSCNGPEFVIELHFSRGVGAATGSPGVRASQEANARLKFVYFPIVEGKENLERILEKLRVEGCGITESFETFSHVSIRRLGRLLPDARWRWLPFMEPRKKTGDKAQILKRCCLRVKCFVDTDAGFNPTPSKTDLAHQHHYTTALKNFGNDPLQKDKEVKLKIYKDGKQVTLMQLEKQYQEWIFQMHDHYDEEIDSGVDQPVLVVNPSNKKGLGISSEVVRVHQVIKRKGASWKSGQKIKVLKGACAGCHKNNMYAKLEYILLEGFPGDAGGEARLICRPLGVPSEKGCMLTVNDGNANIAIQSSVSLPVSIIDSGKCLAVQAAEWELQEEKQRQKMPSAIELLSEKHCQELGIGAALPSGSTIFAGHVPPKEIVAVIRPASFNFSSAAKYLDQKFIVKENFEMCIQIKCRTDDKSAQDSCHIYSGYIKSESLKGFHGFYVFPLGRKFPDIFKKSGEYTFSFSLKNPSLRKYERRVKVKPLSEIARWEALNNGKNHCYNVKVGSSFPPLSLGCYDIYGNRVPFSSTSDVLMKIISKGSFLANIHGMKLELSSDKLTLKIKDTLIETCELDQIRPDYDSTLVVSSQDGLLSVSVPCHVLPGAIEHISTQPRNWHNKLLPGHIIKELILEMLDAYDNHIRGGLEVVFNMDGFCFQDHIGHIRKVDENGCIDLSGLLKVTGGYGKKVSFSVSVGEKIVFKEEFQTEKRELRAAFEVPKSCKAGSLLENMVFEVINTKGEVDKTIHHEELGGQSHLLTIKSDSLDTDESVRYSFCHGRCLVRAISLPKEEGIVHFVAAHSHYPELQSTIEVRVLQTPKVNYDSVQSQYAYRNPLFLPDSSNQKAPKVEHDDLEVQISDRNMLLLQDTSSPKDVEDLIVSLSQKELGEDILKYGLAVGDHEQALKELDVRLGALEQDMSTLQGSLELDLVNHSGILHGKEAMVEVIERKGDSAAAVIRRLFREIPLQKQQDNFLGDIVGVVALLGTVKTGDLSRIFAEYLGEDHMLAIVCRSYAAAESIEKYQKNGRIDREHALHAVARGLGLPINGRFLVICLEDIRPYTGKLSGDPDRKLALPDPILQSGNIPSGYLGYAVNMINLDVCHLHTRTDAGYGLRETLFYCLFGELQVYETREAMKMAKACIKHGAVSLDGGIIRGNGILSLGNWEPEIRFPVVAPVNLSNLSPDSLEILKQIEEKKLELKETLREKRKVAETHKNFVRKFYKKRDRYDKFLERMSPELKSFKSRSSQHL